MDTYSFVMRGLLTEEALDKTGRKTKRSLLDLTEAQLVERLGITLIDDDLVERSQKMSYIFVAICSFENSVREFISKKLLEEKGADWWEQNVKSDVRKRAENRKTAEDGMRWLSRLVCRSCLRVFSWFTVYLGYAQTDCLYISG